MKKKVDDRVRRTLAHTAASGTRSLFILIGDKGKDQVPNLHYMLSKSGSDSSSVRARPSVLWMYKRELGFSSHRKKRMRQVKKMVQRGLLDPDKDDPFELFISSSAIQFCYYSDSDKVLGNTYGMLVLQDFEALTPNLLARTIETVAGGGLVVILLRTMTSLRQLYSLAMDVHAHFRTEQHRDVVPRFNERLVLSLSACASALVLDDELNVLPIAVSKTRGAPSSSSATANLHADGGGGERSSSGDDERALESLQASVREAYPVGGVVQRAKTVDQARALLTFEEALTGRSAPPSAAGGAPPSAQRSTIFLSAARGRGKSAAMGLASALAVAHGYVTVFVTSPSPENLRTFFEFVAAGLDALGYQEHLDYDRQSDRERRVVRVNVCKSLPHSSSSSSQQQQQQQRRRQRICYVDPQTSSDALASADLLVIDEAAAIPLTHVKRLIGGGDGGYHVFLSSTVTGYEGTGRSLSLKLVQQLRSQQQQQQQQQQHQAGQSHALPPMTTGQRMLREVQLDTPIRYASGDPVEAWLYSLLCLEATQAPALSSRAVPHPRDCQLYQVDRDALFSYHRAAEAFLHRAVALFVSSHYKNSPNDLQMLSDAPAHRLFVLLAPAGPNTTTLPDVLCAVQVCLEGGIGRDSARAQLARGKRASGDLIPWTLSQQFQEPAFAQLSGARVVRVATHPDVQGMGYGTRAMEELMRFYAGHVPRVHYDGRQSDLGDGVDDEAAAANGSARRDGGGEVGAARHRTSSSSSATPPPLLHRLGEIDAPPLDYMGVSFGLTHALYRFWSKLGFLPAYVRLTPNELTAEHTCVMIRGEGAAGFYDDWRRRFASLLSYDLRSIPIGLALGMLTTGGGIDGGDGDDGDEEARPGSAAATAAAAFANKRRSGSEPRSAPLTYDQLRTFFSAHDLRRLESYARNMLDYHIIIDLLPDVARLALFGYMPALSLSAAQRAILLALGFQRRSVSDVESALDISATQVLALFNKVMRKVTAEFTRLEEAAVGAELPQGEERERGGVLNGARQQRDDGAASGATSLDDDLRQGATAALRQYALGDTSGWHEALAERAPDAPPPSSVSLPARQQAVARLARREREQEEALRRAARGRDDEGDDVAAAAGAAAGRDGRRADRGAAHGRGARKEGGRPASKHRAQRKRKSTS